MTLSQIRARIESRIVAGAKLPKRPIIAGVMCGLIAGITLGAFTGPAGMSLGLLLGTTVGLVAGYMLAEEEESRMTRHKELDAIIGITRGSMGAGPIKIAQAEDDDDEPLYSTKEAWLAEWLTPAPPGAIE